jgi:hypothetical protein
VENFLTSIPTPGTLFAAILFGAIGLGAFVYGKRAGLAMPMILGAALMGYPYFVSDIWLTFGIGICLCVLLFRFRG